MGGADADGSHGVGVGETVFSAANQGMIPKIVRDPDELSTANGAFFVIQSASANFIGPSVGGALFSIAQWLPFLVDAVSFLMASFLVARIDANDQVAYGSERGLWRAIREGISWCRNQPVMLALLSVMGVVNFAQSGVLAIMVMYVTSDLGASSAVFGVIMGISGAGESWEVLWLPR